MKDWNDISKETYNTKYGFRFVFPTLVVFNLIIYRRR